MRVFYFLAAFFALNLLSQSTSAAGHGSRLYLLNLKTMSGDATSKVMENQKQLLKLQDLLKEKKLIIENNKNSSLENKNAISK